MTSPAPTTSRHRRLLAGLAALTLLTLGAACSGSSEDAASSTSESSADMPAPARDGAAPAEAAGDADGALRSLAESDVAADEAAPTASRQAIADDPRAQAPGDARALIKTGNVALRSDDVPTARFDVGKVLDAHGGEIAEESTQADDAGDIERVRLVARVPVDEFDATMSDFGGVAELIDVTTATEDVSTEVIDNEVRVELQRRSIDRISILLDNAADLRDIVTIERELSRREADLGSLEKRQAFLADQTSMATITLSIEPTRDEQAPPVEDDDETGFLAGLAGGWSALQSLTTGLLTVGGAVVPFALVLLVLAVPARLLLRRLTPRGSTAQTPAAPAA